MRNTNESFPFKFKSAVLLLVLLTSASLGAPVQLVDFSRDTHGWRGNPSTRRLPAENTFKVELIGEDPWVEGGAVVLPEMGAAVKLKITLDAECSNTGECRLYVATADSNFSESTAINLHFQAEPTPHYSGILPFKASAPNARFRIDPPGFTGSFTLRSLSAEPLIPTFKGRFAPPAPINYSQETLSIASGKLLLLHSKTEWNSFACFVNGLLMAQSNPAEQFAYLHDGKSYHINLQQRNISSEKIDKGFRVICQLQDQMNAEWQLVREFQNVNETLHITTSMKINQPRDIAHLPWLSLFAGLETFGRDKQQALLPGIEYLENEPSSNEKEIKGEAANRRLVERYKLCYPMMALTAENRWIAVEWQEPTPEIATVFDSPDRIFNSAGHLLGLWSPAVGESRLQGETDVYGTMPLKADHTYTVKAVITGGVGDTIVDVMSNYVQRKGLPELPQFKPGFDGAIDLLAHGWLKSAARDGLHWRHAVWGDRFKPSQAPDVPAYMLWLAAHTSKPQLKRELTETAHRVIAQMPVASQGIGGISHVKRPVGALLYGNLESYVTQSATRVRRSAANLAANNGYAIYKKAPDKPDYASTLGSNHCNGFTAMSVETMLQDATLTGDRGAIGAALSALDRMTELYAGEVPRGAQPWEMPLHTPDIMASAHLTRCYVLGYLLSRREDYLEQARYWAWSGVSMIYLTPPVEGDVGIYATIAVMGATNWVAPNWIGQPVQWCGLVYRSALEELARVDRRLGATWRQIAHGITLTGLQMTFPVDDPENLGGLLPDYFLLKQQKRDGPAINPGTVQANLAEVYNKTPMYTVTPLSGNMLAHLPGDCRIEKSDAAELRLKIDIWPTEPCRILISSVNRSPASVTLNDKAVNFKQLESANALVIEVDSSGTLRVAF